MYMYTETRFNTSLSLTKQAYQIASNMIYVEKIQIQGQKK